MRMLRQLLEIKRASAPVSTIPQDPKILKAQADALKIKRDKLQTNLTKLATDVQRMAFDDAKAHGITPTGPIAGGYASAGPADWAGRGTHSLHPGCYSAYQSTYIFGSQTQRDAAEVLCKQMRKLRKEEKQASRELRTTNAVLKNIAPPTRKPKTFKNVTAETLPITDAEQMRDVKADEMIKALKIALHMWTHIESYKVDWRHPSKEYVPMPLERGSRSNLWKAKDSAVKALLVKAKTTPEISKSYVSRTRQMSTGEDVAANDVKKVEWLGKIYSKAIADLIRAHREWVYLRDTITGRKTEELVKAHRKTASP